MAPMIIAALASLAGNNAKAGAERSKGQNFNGNSGISMNQTPVQNDGQNMDMGQVEQQEIAEAEPAKTGIGGALSDERLKRIASDKPDIVDAFSKINAIEFKYTDKARDLFGNSDGVDDKTHIGVKAQEVAVNPVAKSAAVIDPKTGAFEIDVREMCLTNTAVLSDVCKRLVELEKRLGQ